MLSTTLRVINSYERFWSTRSIGDKRPASTSPANHNITKSANGKRQPTFVVVGCEVRRSGGRFRLNLLDEHDTRISTQELRRCVVVTIMKREALFTDRYRVCCFGQLGRS